MDAVRAADQQHDPGTGVVGGGQRPEATLQQGVVLNTQAGLAGDLGHQPRQVEAARPRSGGLQHPVALPRQLRRCVVQQGRPIIALGDQDRVAAGQNLVEQQAERLGAARRADEADGIHKIPKADDLGGMMAVQKNQRNRTLLVPNQLADQGRSVLRGWPHRRVRGCIRGRAEASDAADGGAGRPARAAAAVDLMPTAICSDPYATAPGPPPSSRGALAAWQPRCRGLRSRSCALWIAASLPRRECSSQ